MRQCLHCHEPVSETARFCENCGAPLSSDESVPSELALRIRQLMADGQKIEAIKVLREATGLGLAEAKHMVESGMTVGAVSSDLPDEAFEGELLELLRSGNKIEAIKRHRERTHLGLKESKDYVEGLAVRHGIVARGPSGCAGVLAWMLIFIFATARVHQAEPTPPAAKVEKSTEGWFVHHVTSEFQAAPTEIKVLLPDRMEPGKRYPVLYVLPVEAQNEHRYGDGLTEIKRCDLHNKHQLICVAPTFTHLPWYADHPTDKSIRQESYLVKEVVPLVERLYPARADREARLLLGFSKSGWGAWSMLIRHPGLFGRAAAWDAPLDMPRFDQYGADQVFGNQAHFESYRVLPALKDNRELLESPRLILLGYDNFRSHHETAHKRLDEWKIPHIYRDGPQRKHVWNSGWVEDAVNLLTDSSKLH